MIYLFFTQNNILNVSNNPALPPAAVNNLV